MSAPVLPPGLNSIAVIEPALHDLIISQSFLVVLLPLSIALWMYSTKEMRRRPVFILNAVSIGLALTVGVMLDWRSWQVMINPTRSLAVSFNLAISVLGVVQSILVDTILLLRLVSIYPPRHIGLTRTFALILLPVLLKIARIINLILIIKMLADAAKLPNGAEVMQMKFAAAPYVKIEWFAQLFDVTYASSFFLYRIWLHRRQRRVSASTSTGSSSSSFTTRLREIFWIALTNFVIPALFSLVQIIVVYSGAPATTLNDIVLINTNLAVIGVVFASIWTGSYSARSAFSPVHGLGAPASTTFHPPSENSGKPERTLSMRFATRSALEVGTMGTVLSMREMQQGELEEEIVKV